MTQAADLTGRQFTRLTVVRRVENKRNGSARWLCVCFCGKETTIVSNDLTSGRAKSCGCARRFNLLSFRRHGTLTRPMPLDHDDE